MDDLTIRQRKVVDGILEGKSGPAAARAAGYSEAYARKYRPSEHKGVKNALTKEMRRQGINEKRFAQVMDAGLNAKRTICTPGGIVETPDHSVRHKFLETGLRAFNYLKDAPIVQDIGLILLPAPIPVDQWNAEIEKSEAVQTETVKEDGTGKEIL